MPSIQVRAHDANGTPQYGQGAFNFLYDIDAVRQIINDYLLLLQGSWWEDANLGTPVFGQILGGAPQGAVVPLILRQAIESRPFVNRVTGIATSYDRASRAYTFSCTVDTAFGQTVITASSTAYLGT